MPIDLIYDVSVEETQSEWGKCIHAPESMFEVVAGILFKIATEKPDMSQEKWLKRDLVIDYDMQAALFAFATQLLTGNLCIQGGDMRLRQRPDNPCILQQDQGGEWIDVFDYSLCMQGIIDAIDDLSTQESDDRVIDAILDGPRQLGDLWRDFEERYDGTSGSVDPMLVNDGGAANAAVCQAIEQIVKQACRDSLNYKNEESDSVSRASLAIGLGVAILGILAVVASGGIAGPAVAAYVSAYAASGSAAVAAAAIGLTTASLAAWAQNIKDTSAALFGNVAAQREIVCEWAAQLQGLSDISMEDYQSTVDMSSTSSDAQELYSALKPLMQDQPVYYAAFLKAWKREAQFNTAGIDSDCGCDDDPDFHLTPKPGWEHWYTEYRGRRGVDNEIQRWRFTRTANTGFASCVVGAVEPVYFQIVASRIIEGDFQPECWVQLPDLSQVMTMGEFTLNADIREFYRTADGPMPQVFEVDVILGLTAP